MRNATYEDMFVRAFVRETLQVRWIQLLAHPKRRSTITERLYHNASDDLDRRHIVPITPSNMSAASIHDLLVSRGTPANTQCYLISADRELDTTSLELADALERVVGTDSGTIVSCILGKSAYVEAELDRFLLLR